MVSLNFLSRCRARRQARRHHGYEKNTMEALQRELKRLMRIQKMLKRLLKKYRVDNKIDKHVYPDMYMKVKENIYKNKRFLMESIHKFSRAKEPGGEKAAAAPAPQQLAKKPILFPSLHGACFLACA